MRFVLRFGWDEIQPPTVPRVSMDLDQIVGRIWKRVFQVKKARQIFWKTNISYPLIRTGRCAYQGIRNVRFSRNLGCFFFLKHPFWDSPFCLITDEIIGVLIEMKMCISKYRLKMLSLNHYQEDAFLHDKSWYSLNVRVYKANIDKNLLKTCSYSCLHHMKVDNLLVVLVALLNSSSYKYFYILRFLS